MPITAAPGALLEDAERELLRKLFDASFYLAKYPDVRDSGIDPFLHFLMYGAAAGRSPHPLFDTAFYLAHYPQAAKSGLNPVLHFLRCGASAGFNPHPLFDTIFYLNQYPDVANFGCNPLIHFIEHGAREGRDPHPFFDTKRYLAAHPHVAAAGVNALIHYVCYGVSQGPPLPATGYFGAIFFRSCNFCGSQDFRVFRSRPDIWFPKQLYGDLPLSCPEVGETLKLQYLECVRCGLIGVNPLTFFSDINRRSFDGEKDIVAWAAGDYAEYEKGKLVLSECGNRYFSLSRFRRLNRILDVSCGPGITLQWLARNEGWKVTGVDPDRYSVRMAQSRFGLSITNGLIDDVQESSESFDIVWMDNSLEHTFDPLSTMLTAFRLLRKGGAFLIFVPNGDALIVKHMDQHLYWGHWFQYTPPVLFRMLTRIGFSVEKLHASVVAAGDPRERLHHRFSEKPAGTSLPDLAQRGVDVDAVLPAFHVVATGERIGPVLSRTPCYADFFTMLAIRPEDAPEISPLDAELRAVAGQSMLHRKTVNIVETPRDSAPDISDRRVLLASLEGRLVCVEGTASESVRSYFIENGARREVLSAEWLEARHLLLPDDATAIAPELFALLPEGLPIDAPFTD